jgi:multicomponent Na+:H+ antiporter subunit C
VSQGTLYLIAAAAIFGIGVYGLLLSEHVLRKLLALNLMGSGVFLLLVTLGAGEGAPDPVPQAMVLTGIVVAVSATAFALSLLVRLYHETGSTSLEEGEADGE